MDESLLTAAQVARILGVRVSTVYDAVARKRLPAVKLWTGRRRALIRFRRSEIEELIRERTVPADKREQ